MIKFYETHFEEYNNESINKNLHPKLEKMYEKFPTKINDLKNLIFYGPSGIGKYTQMLNSIKKYSPTELKYEKKISVTYNKIPYYFKISDIHFEIDMSLLGCNSKLLWYEIYQQIIDIISSRPNKVGIIVCKYFHDIHSELLENFYSYMQKTNDNSIDLKFILVTEEISFIPDNILNCCEIIHLSRPSRTTYNKCLKTKIPAKIDLNVITNIKNLHLLNENVMMPHIIICNKIIENMKNVDDIKFLKFRDLLYDIFIYNLNITECIFYILSTLIKEKRIEDEKFSDVMKQTYSFFKFYNNNFRPIYHIELYLYYLTKMIHNY